MRDGNDSEKVFPAKEEAVEESNAVADWQPSRKGPALSSPPKYKRRVGIFLHSGSDCLSYLCRHVSFEEVSICGK